RETLWAAAAPYAASPPPTPIELSYGPLFEALAPGVGADVYPLALELVHEGYLAHYRSARVLPADTPLTTRLLAGDQFDAAGLRLVARAGDLDAVALLTRLMASCSWLRSEGAPWDHDDDLWLLCVAGMASSASGGSGLAALRVFDDVAAACRRGRVERLPEIVRRGSATIWLRRPAPLLVALGLQSPERDGDERTPGPAPSAPSSATAATGHEAGDDRPDRPDPGESGPDPHDRREEAP
ncbi:MAG TPA: hypothetical protein VK576_06870, partial [Thermoleophilia bacterium]|nr:hypothetical protein [Thermoleophilia bacterium]